MKNKILIAVLMLVSFCLLASFASALPIEVTNPSPPNGATDITPSATLAITSTVNSSNGSSMMGFMWTNISGVYAQGNWVGPFDNTTINWQMDASDYSTFYEWGVYVNDSWGNDINQSWNFTTEDAPVIPQTPSQQLGFLGGTAKILLGLVLLVIVCGLIYLAITTFFDKKRKDFKAMVETMIIITVAVTILIVAAAMIIAF